MQLEPYIFFYGRCEEALEFYKSALGGTFEITRMKDAPPMPDMPVAPEAGNKVMHASFKGPGFAFMASDGRDEKAVDPDEGNISLSLGFEDKGEADRVFQALSQGGEVKMPLADAFWGGRFGMIADKFGIEWMITAP